MYIFAIDMSKDTNYYWFILINNIKKSDTIPVYPSANTEQPSTLVY